MLFLDRQFRKFNRTASLCLEYELFRLLFRFKKSPAIFSLFRQSCWDPNPVAISSFVPLRFHAPKFVAVCCCFSRFSWPFGLFLAPAFDWRFAPFWRFSANAQPLSEPLWKLSSEENRPLRTQANLLAARTGLEPVHRP